MAPSLDTRSLWIISIFIARTLQFEERIMSSIVVAVTCWEAWPSSIAKLVWLSASSMKPAARVTG